MTVGPRRRDTGPPDDDPEDRSDMAVADDHLPEPAERDQRDLAALETSNDRVARAAESLRRRQHDRDLVAALAAEDFHGPIWQRLRNDLAGYGHAVLMAWMATGAISWQCARKGVPIGPTPTTWTSEERSDLATAAVIAGITLFHSKGLVQGGWRFDGGASLRTYFVGAALRSFRSPYRAWRTRHEEDRRALCTAQGLDLDLEQLAGPASQDTETTVIQRLERDAGLAGLNYKLRLAIVGEHCGYSHQEIAELLSAAIENGQDGQGGRDSQAAAVTAGSVAALLFRHRKRAAGKGRIA